MATANQILKSVAAYMDQKGVKYEIRDERTLAMNFTGDNIQHLPIVIRIDEDGTTAHFTGVRVATVPQDRIANVLLTCNQMNMAWRWIKVYLDNDNDIMADCDAVLDEATAPAECLEITYRMIDIVDKMYPDFMKALYA